LLTLGFNGDPALTGGPVWMQRAVAEGTQMVRVNVTWSQVAPSTPPPGFNPSDPASPGYDWSRTDAAVRDLGAHGLRILMCVESAPAWAEGPGKPADEPPGTWRPDPAKFAAFANALARRYGGRYPDPERPGSYLPKVSYWQPWNEPNLDEYLSPQWSRSGHGWVDTSPIIYRQLLNAFYAAIKRVSPANFVVTAGTSPYGDSSPTYHRPGHQRMPPVRFYRDLFCLRGPAALHPINCPDPAHLDALASHIYGLFGPLWHAANRDDVATPDMYKLAAVLRAAERAGTALPRGHKQLWVTEISWTSKPPASFGVPLATDALWYEQSMYVLWRQGVDTVLLYQLRDAAPNTSGPWGGLYFFSGRPKPAATAFRFPFVTQRIDSDQVQAWGRSPQAGSLRVERLTGGRWTPVQTLSVRGHEIFLRSIALRGAATLRARVGVQTSLPWRQDG
jgi:polysaccharide biosynthesis protein PslG